MKGDIYQTITDRFIEQLKRGTVPWQKPWLSVQNIVSQKPYQGINSLQKLENDPRLIVSAASQAQRGSDFIRGIEHKETLHECQMSPEGMPLTWAREQGIDTRIPGFVHRDNDGDGVSNLLEWKHGSKPTDRLSQPSKQGMSL